jgi:uncharacterized protein with HEPN domain
MTSKREYTDYLRDILDAAGKALEFVGGMDYERFRNDDKTQFAVTRALTIIGEAAKKVPKSVQSRHPEVPWKDMAGMRDMVTHEYFRVDLRRVFETVKRDLPRLRVGVARMLGETEESK